MPRLPDGSGPVRYVILTGDDPALASAWQPLADWKTATGDPARVVTTAWVREHYAGGADLAEKIRLFLRDAHQAWGLAAVLLGGDTDLVPTRMVGVAPNDVSSDYYYACLEGTWDANGNGVYGERPRDDPDMLPEIHVGRVSARTADQVEAFLAKYFTYVQAPPEDGYLDRGAHAGRGAVRRGLVAQRPRAGHSRLRRMRAGGQLPRAMRARSSAWRGTAPRTAS